MTKGDIVPQCYQFKITDIFGGLGHFKVWLSEGSGKASIFEDGLKVVKLGMELSDLVVIFAILDKLSMDAPSVIFLGTLVYLFLFFSILYFYNHLTKLSHFTWLFIYNRAILPELHCSLLLVVCDHYCLEHHCSVTTIVCDSIVPLFRMLSWVAALLYISWAYVLELGLKPDLVCNLLCSKSLLLDKPFLSFISLELSSNPWRYFLFLFIFTQTLVLATFSPLSPSKALQITKGITTLVILSLLHISPLRMSHLKVQ